MTQYLDIDNPINRDFIKFYLGEKDIIINNVIMNGDTIHIHYNKLMADHMDIKHRFSAMCSADVETCTKINKRN